METKKYVLKIVDYKNLGKEPSKHLGYDLLEITSAKSEKEIIEASELRFNIKIKKYYLLPYADRQTLFLKCPKEKCRNHSEPNPKEFRRDGFYRGKIEGMEEIQRFVCLLCGTRMNALQGSPYQHMKSHNLLNRIKFELKGYMPINKIAREFKVSTTSIHRQIKAFAHKYRDQKYFLNQCELTPKFYLLRKSTNISTTKIVDTFLLFNQKGELALFKESVRLKKALGRNQLRELQMILNLVLKLSDKIKSSQVKREESKDLTPSDIKTFEMIKEMMEKAEFSKWSRAMTEETHYERMVFFMMIYNRQFDPAHQRFGKKNLK